MKHILLLFTVLLVGCAVPTKTLLKDAKECVATSHNDKGVIGASPEQSAACWVAANQRLKAIEKREEREKKRKGESCGKGLIKWCDQRWGRCGCVREHDAREALRRMVIGF